MTSNLDAAAAPPFLSTRRGVATLLLLCAIQFLDVLDSSIMNVALPSIQRDLGFSQQNLQWVLSGYVLTYGGFLLLGGRAADLVGRRRVLVAGVVLFAGASLAGGLSTASGALISARLVQGFGAALMAPAGLSILTTTFTNPVDRHKALGLWGAVSGLGAAVGVFFGGVLSEGPGWRWVLFVNLPFCALILASAFALISAERKRPSLAGFDIPGAVLVTAGVLLLVYALIKAPTAGWTNRHTIGELATAAVLLAAFALNELRRQNPLTPFSIFRTKGLLAADTTQLIGFAGFYSMFFFLTLYMQNILGFSPIRAGAAYLPVTIGIGVAATVSARLFGRVGTKPVIVVGSVLAALAIYYLSRLPSNGDYVRDLLPGLVVMSVGLGGVFVGVTTAANAGVAETEAGLAAGLLNTAQQLGAALGLAIFSALATARTNNLLAAHASVPHALTSGYHRALVACSIFVGLAAIVAVRAANSRGAAATKDSTSERLDRVPVGDA